MGYESLEDRRLLAIDWVNQGNDNFSIYGSNEAVARQIVNRAIEDWEAVILDFDYDGDNNPSTNNTFNLTLSAAALASPTARGQTSTTFANNLPTAATISLDDNAGGFSWYFDSAPDDDTEFTAISNYTTAAFIDATESAIHDFYRTTLHEIGHAMGLASTSPAFSTATANPLTTLVGPDPGSGGGTLFNFYNPNGQFGITVTFTTNGGRHIYEGAHPGDLLNPARAIDFRNQDLEPTIRQLISDLDVKLLADAYDYSVVLPSTLDTAHATLDTQTGTLLVQGGLTAAGASQNDLIDLSIVGQNIRVLVNGTTELVPLASVTQIVIAGNGNGTSGADSITVVCSTLDALRKDVQYVVSSNQDSAVAGTLGDGVVDLNSIIPGRQVALRAAIVDANGTAAGSARSIYVPRGNYNLTISGTGGDTQGDLDVNRHLTIIGAGAGATVINAATLATRDRVFEIASTGSLDLSRVTLTGGYVTSSGGGGIRVANNPTAGVVELNLSDATIVGNTADPAVNSGNGAG